MDSITALGVDLFGHDALQHWLPKLKQLQDTGLLEHVLEADLDNVNVDLFLESVGLKPEVVVEPITIEVDYNKTLWELVEDAGINSVWKQDRSGGLEWGVPFLLENQDGVKKRQVTVLRLPRRIRIEYLLGLLELWSCRQANIEDLLTFWVQHQDVAEDVWQGVTLVTDNYTANLNCHSEITPVVPTIWKRISYFLDYKCVSRGDQFADMELSEGEAFLVRTK